MIPHWPYTESFDLKAIYPTVPVLPSLASCTRTCHHSPVPKKGRGKSVQHKGELARTECSPRARSYLHAGRSLCGGGSWYGPPKNKSGVNAFGACTRDQRRIHLSYVGHHTQEATRPVQMLHRLLRGSGAHGACASDSRWADSGQGLGTSPEPERERRRWRLRRPGEQPASSSSTLAGQP